MPPPPHSPGPSAFPFCNVILRAVRVVRPSARRSLGWYLYRSLQVFAVSFHRTSVPGLPLGGRPGPKLGDFSPPPWRKHLGQHTHDGSRPVATNQMLPRYGALSHCLSFRLSPTPLPRISRRTSRGHYIRCTVLMRAMTCHATLWFSSCRATGAII